MFIVNLGNILPLIKSREEAEAVLALNLLLAKIKAYTRGYSSLLKHKSVVTHLNSMVGSHLDCRTAIVGSLLSSCSDITYQRITALEIRTKSLLEQLVHIEASIRQYSMQNRSLAKELGAAGYKIISEEKRVLGSIEKNLSARCQAILQLANPQHAAGFTDESSAPGDKRREKTHFLTDIARLLSDFPVILIPALPSATEIVAGSDSVETTAAGSCAAPCESPCNTPRNKRSRLEYDQKDSSGKKVDALKSPGSNESMKTAHHAMTGSYPHQTPAQYLPSPAGSTPEVSQSSVRSTVSSDSVCVTTGLDVKSDRIQGNESHRATPPSSSSTVDRDSCSQEADRDNTLTDVDVEDITDAGRVASDSQQSHYDEEGQRYDRPLKRKLHTSVDEVSLLGSASASSPEVPVSVSNKQRAVGEDKPCTNEIVHDKLKHESSRDSSSGIVCHGGALLTSLSTSAVECGSAATISSSSDGAGGSSIRSTTQ